MVVEQGGNAPVLMPPQSIYEESEKLRVSLGTRLHLGDRTFRYAQAGETTVPGKVVQSPVPATDHTGLAVTTVAAGIKLVTLTNGASTALVKDDYRNGHLWCDTGTNVGHLYRIKRHPGALVNATCEFELYDELVEALTNAQETVSLVLNRYKDLILTVAVPTARPAGIPPIDVTDEYFYWLQTGGPAACLVETAVTVGEVAAVSDATAGAIQTADVANEQVIGTIIRSEGSGEYCCVDLSLEL